MTSKGPLPEYESYQCPACEKIVDPDQIHACMPLGKPDTRLDKIISLLETIIHNQELDLSDRRIIE